MLKTRFIDKSCESPEAGEITFVKEPKTIYR